MIRFAYPNIENQKYIGCSRFIVMKHGSVSEGYDYADPNTGNFSAVRDVANRLVPESFESDLEVYEIQDDPQADYLGTSMDMAYLLALVNRSRKTVWDSNLQDMDIWCTGSICIVNGNPFLKAVDKAAFDIKFESFLLSEKDRIFIVPSSNIEPRHKVLCNSYDAKRINISGLNAIEALNCKQSKIILEVNASDTELLINKLFMSSNQTSYSLESKFTKKTKLLIGLLVAMIASVVSGTYLIRTQFHKNAAITTKTINLTDNNKKSDINPIEASEDIHTVSQLTTPSTMTNTDGKFNNISLTNNIKSVNKQLASVLMLAYGQEIDKPSPSAAIAVLFKTNDDLKEYWQNLRDGTNLSSRDNYRIIFQPESPSYFYVFQIDSTGKLDWIFPKNSTTPFSVGSNPVMPGSWTQLPSQREAYHLDENIGIEHIYVVATASRWEALEKTLLDANKAQPVPIAEPIALRTRGIGGTRIVQGALPEKFSEKSGDIQKVLLGKSGVLVQEKWFKHEESK